ncbi:MAG: hypothetical protein WBB25_15470, partial [Sulfitobacter sp.]
AVEQARAAAANELSGLETRLEETQSAMAATGSANAPAPVVAPEPATEPAISTTTAQPGLTPRPVSVVDAALRNAPGLPSSQTPEVEKLQNLLVNGACATDALQQSFGTINRQTLVSLVRTLGGC